MSLLAAKLFHEIFQHRIHDAVIFGTHGVDGHVTEKDRVGANPQVMLDFTENDLLTRPTVLDNAVEPGMFPHGNFGGKTP
jgi:hypothetical protein